MNARNYQDAVKAARNGNRAQMARVLLDGRYYTFAQMAEESGKTIQHCKQRYGHKKRNGVWPITMADLL